MDEDHQHKTYLANAGRRSDCRLSEFPLSHPSESTALPTSEERLPDPEFPFHSNAKEHLLSEKEYNSVNLRRNVKCWLLPYLRSRVYAGEFRPILSYLFTDRKCNIDCHYCWSFDNKTTGMHENIAKRSIDWLHSVGCRVIAIMGGEPLIRPKFIHRVVYYGAKQGFFMYLPTNGLLMRPEVIDHIGDAGVAVWNLAVDCVDERPGLAKALNRVRSHFEYLVKMQRRYGYLVFFNINICRNNLDDVRQLTEIARDQGIATDYHINQLPMFEQNHFKHKDNNSTFLRPEDYNMVDELLDYLCEKHRQGYKIVNSQQNFADMKKFMRGEAEPWECRAGHNSSLIRTDGTLAPCFAMYSENHDWGAIENPKFDLKQLKEMKKSCNRHCLSTCQHTLGYAYSAGRVFKWLSRQALNGFRGVTGSF